METNDVNSAAIFEELQLRKEVNEHGWVQYYNKDNKIHRVHGPARIYPPFEAEDWYQNGLYHRIGGPAIITARGKKVYYLYGIMYTKEDYWQELERLKNGNQ